MSDHPSSGAAVAPIVDPPRNCWTVARAERAAVIVDACDYFRVARAAMLKAKKRILLIGWDFDARIALERPEEGGLDGETLFSFLIELAKKPGLTVKILKWDVGALKQLGRGRSMWMLMRWALHRRIDFEFDRAHPIGCSHHQKIVVIDDCLAVCGGIDMTGDRWDTRAHRHEDPRRVRPGGQPYKPWHDATMIVDGEAAKALARLSAERWLTATGKQLSSLGEIHDCWPDNLAVDFRDVDVAVARTRAEYGEVSEVREVQSLFVDMIRAATRWLYVENQYLTSPVIAAAIIERMAEPDPPEIVLIEPLHADDWLGRKAMDGARIRLVRAIRAADKQDRFRLYTPVTSGGEDIYVHAKLSIVDDRLIRVGSANLNNRSMGLDSECDLAIDCALDGNAGAADRIAAIRADLLGEHLDVPVETVAATLAETGSLIATIERLRGEGKTLVPFETEPLDDIEAFIADNQLLDPEAPDEMFNLTGRKRLFARLRERLRTKRTRRFR